MSFPGYVQSSFFDATKAVAAPGAMWTRSGNVKNAYLRNGDVVSSTTGFPIRLNNAELTYIAVTNEQVSTFDVEIFEWDGATETLLATVSVVAARGSNFTPATPIPITFGNELRAKVNNTGSSKNPVVIAFAVGDVPA